MNRKSKFTLVHGIINVLLPFLPVLMHRGVFGTAANAWEYIFLIFTVQLFPFISALMGIIIACFQLSRVPAAAVKAGLLLSCCGLAMNIVFRFILRI